MKTRNLFALILLIATPLFFTGCESSPEIVKYDLKNDPIVKMIDLVDVKEGQDLVRVTTKSGQTADVDKDLLDFVDAKTLKPTTKKANLSFSDTGEAQTDNANLVPFLPVADVELSTMAKLGKSYWAIPDQRLDTWRWR